MKLMRKLTGTVAKPPAEADDDSVEGDARLGRLSVTDSGEEARSLRGCQGSTES